MASEKSNQTLLVAFLLCLVCSLGVSFAAVSLRSLQEENKLIDRQKNIASVSGLTEKSSLSKDELAEVFTQIKAYAVNLDTGEKIANFDTDDYDQNRASKDPEMSLFLNDSEDIVAIGRRENISIIYEVYDAQNTLDAVILPVRSYGLWSMMYGYLALEEDGATVRGITFYEHAETPGLGGNVDGLKWKASWAGKTILGEDGTILLNVGKAQNAAPGGETIDALSGATFTTRGVDNMVQFWLGDKGYQKYIEKNLKAL